MKFCSHCGKEIMDEAVICPSCGCAVSSSSSVVSNPYDAPDTGWAILGFFIPIVGLILYLMNKDKSPLKAKSAGKGALIGFCVGAVSGIIYSIIIAGMYI